MSAVTIREEVVMSVTPSLCAEAVKSSLERRTKTNMYNMLPPFLVIFTQSGVEVIIGETTWSSFTQDWGRFRMLLEVFNIVGCMSSFQSGQIAGALVLPFPQEVLP